MGNVVIFGNQKGGVGKSTLAVLYAWWLADVRRQSVCLIDLDTQGNSSKSLRRSSAIAEAAELFGQDVGPMVPSRGKTIALAPGSKKLADVELAKAEVVIPAFRRNVMRLAQDFDAVVIDTPPALGLRMSAALMSGNAVACPIELEAYSIDGVAHMLRAIFGVRRRYNPQLRLAAIVLNRFNPHSLRQKAAMQELALNFREFVIPARISTRSALPEALAAGVPVWRLPKSSAREASLEVMRVFELLQQRIDGSSEPVPADAQP
ncbi:chromosome partitioning protein [Variovorax boronicumulans]|uniref:ParA family protein n=1 Tax=Variovorax boronicumulans TaxID=436515 RepID=UPI002780D2A4|nr:ParA family protein [Variovorax boronicumulans]MDP9912474.1 chromosome partitioning protein [Variovorax boronicumulans]